jgi:hypothetical protein
MISVSLLHDLHVLLAMILILLQMLKIPLRWAKTDLLRMEASLSSAVVMGKSTTSLLVRVHSYDI